MACRSCKDTKELLTRVGPKIECRRFRWLQCPAQDARADHEDRRSAGEIIERVHRQTNRVDTMLTRTLDTVDRAGAVVADVLSVPLRQLSGFAAFARAAFGSLRPAVQQPLEPRPTHSAADKDLFV